MTDASTTPHNGAHPPTVVDKDAAYRATSEGTELIRTDAGDVSAGTVTMDRSGAEHVTAERVRLERSGAKAIQAKSAQLERSGTLNLSAEHVVLHGSSAANVSAKDVRIVKSNVGILRADSAAVEGRLRALVHVGPACDNAKPVFDGPGALRFGAALGVVLLIGGRLLRAITGR